MNGGSGLWIGRSTSDGASEKTINNLLMPKFRPIAPKPADGNSFSDGRPPETIQKVVLRKTTKRKYVRVRKSKNTKSSKKSSPAVNLQLMPGKNESQKSPDGGSARDMNVPTLNIQAPETCRHDPDVSIMKSFLALPENDKINETDPMIMETLVTIESMTDAYAEATNWLGSNDSEILKNLKVDTCPAFVTDGFNKVELVNDAFVRLVSGETWDGSLRGLVVRLVVREEPPCGRRVFTCRVKINYTWRKEKCPRMVPCDVWRLDGGGFAWRLDVKAALGLGF